MGELKYKYNRLKNTDGKRIIIVGGSGMAFDVDSSSIKENFPEYELVNLGMYAALGTASVLDMTISNIHDGDLVIFAPEQSKQTLSDYLGGDYAWQALDGAFYILPYFFNSEKNISLMLSAFPRFSMEKLRLFITASAPDPNSVYRKSAFNEYGDIADLLPQNVMISGYDKNMEISYDKNMISADYIDYLNDRSSLISKKGGTLLFAYCPANKQAVSELIATSDKSTALDDYAHFLSEHLSFEIIGNPHNSVMDSEWFYDTNFHLNSSGKKLYTRQLIRDLKAYLSDSSLTAIEIPQKPALLYDSSPETKVLIAGTYSNNTTITSITIDEDFSTIEDYAFKGCTSLKEIHINNTVPSSIRIGQHLLDGTDANIYVPAEALSLYKTDYRFSIYSSRIYAEK
ncbi:leucine-rich repeat protein [Butyrivibrio sp. AE2015]|uniref:leucine-rich repeat protein n=1 Tax=Butyrivibrio sp. AE2015 TaxID=1280663 RepID=UPI0003B332E1|nr:leucine-rich repeat protein [Butyrivibrio sp. AE2015]